MSDKLTQSLRQIFAQFGGGTPPTSPFGPGGVNFGRPGGQSSYQVNRYYEVPIDSNIKRLNDPSLGDETLSVEARLQIFHSDIENDLRQTILDKTELSDLKRSDSNLRKTKILSTRPSPPKDKQEWIDVAMEVLLDTVRLNSDEKHPFEDVNPPVIKPSRRHTVSQTNYINRGTGRSPFSNIEDDVDRSPVDVARYTSPPDGQPRAYPYKNQADIEEYLQKQPDIDFNGQYGTSRAFDFPQDAEQPNENYKNIYDLLDDMSATQQAAQGQSDNNPNDPQEDQLENWRKKLVQTLKNGPGKAHRQDQYFGDTRDALQEPQGVSDKYQDSAFGAAGLPNWGFSTS